MEGSIEQQHKPLARRARMFSWPAPRFFTQSTRRRQWPSFVGLKQEISERKDLPATLRVAMQAGTKSKRNKISRQDAKAQRTRGESGYNPAFFGGYTRGGAFVVWRQFKDGPNTRCSSLPLFALLRLGVRFSSFTLCGPGTG